MNDAGYTLTEALAALLMIGLAMTGMGEALHVFANGQLRAAALEGEGADGAKIRQAVAELPTDVGPFVGAAGRLEGSPQALSYPCGVASLCGLRTSVQDGKVVLSVDSPRAPRRLPLARMSDLRLAYLSARDGSTWPTWPNGRAGDRLGAVAVFATKGPVAILRFAKTQRGVCAFDAGLGDCRSDDGPRLAGR